MVNALVAGEAPSDTPTVTNARLVALIKKSGDLRPIAVSETLRRLVAKCCCHKVKEKAVGLLAPHALGTGVPGGVEAVVHSTRAVLRDHGHKADHALLKWDYKNAFNMVDRSAIIGVVREVLPELSAWVEFCYARFSDLFWGEHTISSECGVQQGDPLGPLLFSLVLQKVVSFLATQDLLLNAWFLDDGTIAGERAVLSVLYEQISLMSSELGMVVGDCELFWPSGDPSFPLFHPSIKRANDTGVSILGAPVGSDDFAVRYIMSRVEKVKLIHSKLACLDDGQVELCLLRACVGLPKLNYSIRTCPASVCQPALAAFDDALHVALKSVLGTNFGSVTATQISLPISLTGLGVRNALDTSDAAFVGSCAQTAKLCKGLYAAASPNPEIEVARASLDSRVDKPIAFDDLSRGPKVQLRIQRLLDVHRRNELIEGSSARDRARLHCLSQVGGGDWLKATPIAALGLRIDSRTFRAAARYHLGLPMYPVSGTSLCPVCKKALLDPWGDHAVCCNTENTRIAKHNSICDVLRSFFRRAGCSVHGGEPLLIAGRKLRPGDVFVYGWESNRDAAFDVMITNPMRPQFILRTATLAGTNAAIESAFCAKDDKSYDLLDAMNKDFTPLIFTTFGNASPTLEKLISDLVVRVADRTGVSRSEVGAQIRQGISLALQRFNAMMFLARDIIT